MLPLKDNIPTDRFPVVTVVLILLNLVMFLGFQQPSCSGSGCAVPNDHTIENAEIPYEITHPGKECTNTGTEAAPMIECEGLNGFDGPVEDQPATWITVFLSMFMHGGLLHIGGNMLFLWIFGNNVEDSMGRARFVAFYLLGGLAATAAQVVFDPNSTTPTLGASGAVAAVLGAYALLYPRARVVTLIFIVFFITVLELPAALVLFGWAVLQVLSASVDNGVGGVAYMAHIGGFAFGLALIKLFATRQKDDYVQPRLPVY